MEKDNTTRQRLEERFPSDLQIIQEYIGGTDWCSGAKHGAKLMRSQCLTASEELIGKEIEKRDKLLENMNNTIRLASELSIASKTTHYKNGKSLGRLIKESLNFYSDFLKGKEQ